MLDFMLLADAAVGVDSPTLGTGLLNLTGTGFAVWFGWYATTRTIPNIVKDFREEMAREREFHQDQVDKLVQKVEASACRHPTANQS